MEKQENIEEIFINRIGNISKKWGFSEPTGRIIGAMLFSEEPLTQKEIADKTGYTLSLVSPNLKILEELEISKKERGIGKEKIYRINVSFIELFNKMIERFLKQDILPFIDELDQAKDKNPEKKKIIEKISKDYKKVEKYMCLFEKIAYMNRLKEKKLDKLFARR
jgi:DNA-binding transcriptional regulator GbsR (MarR family)